MWGLSAFFPSKFPRLLKQNYFNKKVEKESFLSFFAYRQIKSIALNF